jgi:hypothetical protein
MDEVTGEYRRLDNKELYALYPSSDFFRVIKSRRMRLAEHMAHTWDRRGLYRIFVGRPEGRSPFGRPTRW